MDQPYRIGFIGLGRMGQPMAKRLLQPGGYSLVVYDQDPAHCKLLTDQGATMASDPISLVQQTQILFSMLPSSVEVERLYLGEQGLLKHMPKEHLIVDCSSSEVSLAQKLEQAGLAKGIAVLDAPVSGGVMAAEKGELTLMIGGSVKAYQQVLPICQHLAKRVIHVGNAGMGQAAKLCNNMLLAISMIGVAEAFVLAEKLGLSGEQLFAVCSESSGQCWSLTQYCPAPGLVPSSPANRDYAPGFTSQLMAKDLRASQKAAQSSDAFTPLGQHAWQLYEEFCQAGNAQKDFSAIITWRRFNSEVQQVVSRLSG